MGKVTIVKKAYLKPRVEFVDFSLTGSIAATCVHKGTNTDSNSCGYLENGWLVYAQNSICDAGIDKEFCYHVPTEDSSIFGS